MTLNNVIFIDSLPKLDLHGLDRESAKYYINLFVKENIKLKNEVIIIVHGVGAGILRNATHECLKLNRDVVEYKLYNFNIGCTLVRLKFDK